MGWGGQKMTNDNISFMNSPLICDICNFVSDGVGDSKRDKDADPKKTLPPHTSDAHMSKIVKFVKNCQNCQKLSKIFVKFVKNRQNVVQV